MAVYKDMLAAAQGGYASSASPGLDAEAVRVSAVARLQVGVSCLRNKFFFFRNRVSINCQREVTKIINITVTTTATVVLVFVLLIRT